jgi:hypothetical protein
MGSSSQEQVDDIQQDRFCHRSCTETQSRLGEQSHHSLKLSCLTEDEEERN